MADLVRSLTPEECLVPGYYEDPPWSVRDVSGHVGTWLAEAAVQFGRLTAGTYEGHDIDIDALNATFLAALRDQPWDVCWIQANAGRTRMRQAWTDLREPSDEAAWCMSHKPRELHLGIDYLPDGDPPGGPDP